MEGHSAEQKNEKPGTKKPKIVLQSPTADEDGLIPREHSFSLDEKQDQSAQVEVSTYRGPPVYQRSVASEEEIGFNAQTGKERQEFQELKVDAIQKIDASNREESNGNHTLEDILRREGSTYSSMLSVFFEFR